MIFAQYNSIWIGGTPGIFPADSFGGSMMRIYPDTTVVEIFDMPMYMLESTTIISKGPDQLEFYSNNCIIINRNHEIMDGGDSLWHPSEQHTEESCTKGYGNAILRRGILAMPIPEKENRYLQLYLRYDTLTDFNYFPTTLLSCEIDMNQNNGLGKVVNPKKIILKDTFADQMDVVRHGNGRDWWIFIDKVGTNKLRAFLLTPDGIVGPYLKDTPFNWSFPAINYNLFESQFSPDGKYYARIDFDKKVLLSKFDRCTGEFSCPLLFDFDILDEQNGGVSFSPNSRFLYANTATKLFQYDLLASNIDSSRLLIDTYDGFQDIPGIFKTYFSTSQLLADGKIYMSPGFNSRYLHVINKPNERGKACNFAQHSVNLPTFAGDSFPMYPNFNLYDWQNSPCDTLGIDPIEPERPYLSPDVFRLIPNPASDHVEVIIPEDCGKGQITVYNSTGYRMTKQKIDLTNGYHFEGLDTHDWNAGIYFVEFISEMNMRFFKKLAIVK